LDRSCESEEVWHKAKVEQYIQHTLKRRKANWNDHILRRSYNLKHGFEGNIEGGIEVKGKRRRRRKQILNDLKETRKYCELQEEPLGHTLWRTRIGI
jgi:hypothetical protein